MIQITNTNDKLTFNEDLILNNDSDIQQQFGSPNKNALKHKLEKNRRITIVCWKENLSITAGKED